MKVGELKKMLQDFSDDCEIGMKINIEERSVFADIKLGISDEIPYEMTLDITPSKTEKFLNEFDFMINC